MSTPVKPPTKKAKMKISSLISPPGIYPISDKLLHFLCLEGNRLSLLTNL
jgi:hypothetical protein